MFGHSCSSPHHLVPAAAFKQAPKVVASVADLTMEVFKQADPVYTQKYVGEPFEAVQIKDSYVINGQVINAGDYLMEASTSDGTRWVPMSKEFFEANYVQDIETRVASRIFAAINKLYSVLPRHSVDVVVTEILEQAAARGDKFILYNPSKEDVSISSPSGNASFITNERLKKLGGKISNLLEAAAELKEVVAEF